MATIRLAVLGLVAVGLIGPTRASAEARATAAPTGAIAATARLGVSVKVPRILYLRVGDAGANVNTVRFEVGLRDGLTALDARDEVYAGRVPPRFTTTRADDAGTSNGSVPVRLWTNNGTVTLGCSAPALSAGPNVIALSAIRVTSSSSALRHPGSTLACASSTRGSAGVNNLAANWTYRYAPATLPPAGTYRTTVTYTASQP